MFNWLIIYGIIDAGINQFGKIDEPDVTASINLEGRQREFTARNRFRGGPFRIFWPRRNYLINFVRGDNRAILESRRKNCNRVHVGIQ